MNQQEFQWHREKRLRDLAEPYPDKYIRDDGRGNSYVPHHIVTQRLIHIFRQPPKIEILREVYDGEVLTGVLMRLTVPHPDFEPVEEFGEADNPQSKTNGARAKDACSDAIKRCAMRLGNGLHLWAQDSYFLFDKLAESQAESTPVSGSQTGTTEPTAASTSPDTAAPPRQGERDGRGSSPSVEDLLELGGWAEIKPIMHEVLRARAKEGHFEHVPRDQEHLGDLSPDAIDEIHRRLSGKLAV